MASVTLPRFIVVKSCENDYLGYMHENDWKSDGYLTFSETLAISPHAKFEVKDSAAKDGLVHKRSCRNNKYWARTKNLSITGKAMEKYWITATAIQPEEDQSKKSCSVFKPISVDPAMNTVRFMHVQSGDYLCLWPLKDSSFTRCVLAYNNVCDGGNGSTVPDIFTIIDRESILTLPRFLAFKGDDNRYLRLHWINRFFYLLFNTSDISDPNIPWEIIPAPDGSVLVKSISSSVHWRGGGTPGRITEDLPPNSSSVISQYLFRPFKVDDQTIALLNLGHNMFCRRFSESTESLVDDGLYADVLNITREARLTLEDPFITTKVVDFRYDLANFRIYDQRIIMANQKSAENNTQQTNILTTTLSYETTRTSSWNVSLSLTLGYAISMNVGIPLITSGTVEMSAQIQAGVEFGQTVTKTTTLEVSYQVEVPPMTRTTVRLLATYASCDVPFTYTQRGTLYNGRVVTSEMHGTYVGSNSYNLNFQTIEEPL